MKPPNIVTVHFLSTKWSKKLFTINHYELQNGKCIVTQKLSAYEKYTKDFSWGFYCTDNIQQAIRRANREVGEQIINYYNYEPNNNLKILKFPEMSDEWLDFIGDCRSGKIHRYDIVEGPMVADTIWNYVNDFFTGRINRKQFWTLTESKHLPHQFSFHTLSALDSLTFVKSTMVYDKSTSIEIETCIHEKFCLVESCIDNETKKFLCT